MVKLHLLKNLNNLIEAFQDNEIKFSFLVKKDEDYYQITTPAKCREYFNEFLMKNHHPKKFKFVTTYGFQYNYDEHPWDLSTTYMSMKFVDSKQLDVFMKNISFLHEVEDFNKVPRTVISPCDQENTVVILADSFWNSKCILMNIFTWILKLCSLNIQYLSYKDLYNQHAGTTEINYVNTISPRVFNSLLCSLDNLREDASKYVDGSDNLRLAGSVHAFSGIISLHNAVFRVSTIKFAEKFTEIFKKIFTETKPAVEFLKVSV